MFTALVPAKHRTKKRAEERPAEGKGGREGRKGKGRREAREVKAGYPYRAPAVLVLSHLRQKCETGISKTPLARADPTKGRKGTG
jgi:hypothetical protein